MKQPIKDTKKIKPLRQGQLGDSAIESEDDENIDGPD